MTIEQAKDQAAIWFGYKNYQDAIIKIAANKSGDINHAIDKSMQIYADAKAKDESSKFAHWLANLPIREMVTVNPPAGSGGSHGIYELTFEQLYEKYQNSQL